MEKFMVMFIGDGCCGKEYNRMEVEEENWDRAIFKLVANEFDFSLSGMEDWVEDLVDKEIIMVLDGICNYELLDEKRWGEYFKNYKPIFEEYRDEYWPILGINMRNGEVCWEWKS